MSRRVSSAIRGDENIIPTVFQSLAAGAHDRALFATVPDCRYKGYSPDTLSCYASKFKKRSEVRGERAESTRKPGSFGATYRRRFSFCVELDRGTQWSEQYKRKVRAYLAMWESGLYEKHYNTRSLTVLTVVTTGDAEQDANRVQQLLAITNSQKDVARANTFEDLFYLTTLNKATPEAILTDPFGMWQGKRGCTGC